MKTKQIITALILLFFSTQIKAQYTKVELQAAGLTCSMCSKSIHKQLKTLSFVDSIGVDLSIATFIIFLKTNEIVDFNLLKLKVEDAGFSVASLKVFYNFKNFSVETNSSFTNNQSTFNFISTNKPQVLNGTVAFKIIDKGFVSTKEYKKYASVIKLSDTKNTYNITL